MTNQPERVPTRQRILAAAIEEIAAKGLGGARIRSIAQRAGVNNALVHYHFGRREDLLVEAVGSLFNEIADMAVAPLESDSIAEVIGAMSDIMGSISPAEPRWQVLMEVMVHARRIPRLTESTIGFLERYRAVLQKRLDRAVARERLPADTDTAGAALALMAMFDGLGLYAYVEPDLDIARAGRAIAALLKHLDQGDPP